MHRCDTGMCSMQATSATWACRRGSTAASQPCPARGEWRVQQRKLCAGVHELREGSGGEGAAAQLCAGVQERVVSCAAECVGLAWGWHGGHGHLNEGSCHVPAACQAPLPTGMYSPTGTLILQGWQYCAVWQVKVGTRCTASITSAVLQGWVRAGQTHLNAYIHIGHQYRVLLVRLNTCSVGSRPATHGKGGVQGFGPPHVIRTYGRLTGTRVWPGSMALRSRMGAGHAGMQARCVCMCHAPRCC